MFWKKKKEKDSSEFEDLCTKIDTEVIKSTYENGGLYQSIAVLILMISGNMKDNFLKHPEMAKLFHGTNPDVLIVESAAAIQAQLAYSTAINPLDLDEEQEEEFKESIYDALALIYVFATKQAGFSNLEEKMASRSYSPNTMEAMEEFMSIIRASVGALEPVEGLPMSPIEIPIIEDVFLNTAVVSLWSTFVTAAVESSHNIARAHFANEI